MSYITNGHEEVRGNGTQHLEKGYVDSCLSERHGKQSKTTPDLWTCENSICALLWQRPQTSKTKGWPIRGLVRSMLCWFRAQVETRWVKNIKMVEIWKPALRKVSGFGNWRKCRGNRIPWNNLLVYRCSIGLYHLIENGNEWWGHGLVGKVLALQM